MPWQNTAIEDTTTRTYLDEIGRVLLIDQRQEQEYALPIQRREYIKQMRAQDERDVDAFNVYRMLHRIADNAPAISGLFRQAGEDPDPTMAQMRWSAAFHELVDKPAQPETIRTVRKWSHNRSEEKARERIRTISLDTLCITGVAIHTTDDCRLSDLATHLDDSTFRTRLYQLSHHLKDELDELCCHGDECQQKLAEANLRLVVSIAKNYVGLNIPLNDLIQEGNIGLMTGAERFDHRRGLKFSTFATWWIRHSIHQCLTKQRRTVRLPEHKIKLISQITNARRELSQDNQRTPTNEEVAEYLEMEVDLIENADMINQPIMNLDTPIADESETTLADIIASDCPTVEDEVCTNDRMDVIQAALDHLTEMERNVIQHRYGLMEQSPKTLAETARELGLSNHHHVRDAERSALEKLQTKPELRRLLADYA